MQSIDRRSRSDADITFVGAPGFLAERLPGLLDRNGRLVARGMAFYDVPPLAVDVGGCAFSIVCDGTVAAVEPGRVDGALLVELDAERFSDFAQDLRNLNTFWVAGDVPLHGTPRDLAAWDVIWRALLDGWPVHQPGMIEFIAANGTPLDLGHGFGPDDDPVEIAHFLREAGFLHLRGWLDPDDMAQIAADMDAALPAYAPDDGRSWWATLSDGTRTCVRMQGFVDHSPTTAALLDSPVWTRLQRTIGDDAGDPLVPSPARGLEALVKPLGVVEGLSDLPWHRDCSLGRHSYKCCSVTVGVAVTEGGPTSGELRVVAGSHRANVPATGVRRDLDLPVVPLPTAPGDLTVHLSCTLHEATAPTERPRKVLYTGFTQPPRPDDGWDGLGEARDLRERAHKLRSQVPSPVPAGPAVPARGSAWMKLWPDEYEDLRTEARDMGEMIAGLLNEGDAPDGSVDPAGRVEFMRRAIAAIEVPDPRAVDEEIAGVPCRTFRPEGVAPTAVYLDFHGGGMMIGSPRLDDTRNAAYMEQLGVAVVSVDYRLAPEHPFPEGSDDCLAVAGWLVENAEAQFGTGRLLIGGESAGGYYTVNTLLRVRDELGPDAVDRFRAANVIFGVFDISRTPSQRGLRVADCADMLDPGGIEFFSEQYTPGMTEAERRSPAVSPLYADVRGLPPAIFTVGTADHLLDDSLFLSQRWAAAGNATELGVYPDCGHGFTAFPTELAKRANERINTFLAAALAAS